MRLTRLIVLALGSITTGCHTLQPLSLEEAQPGMEVQARVSASHAAELSDYLPNETDRLIEGTVLEAEPGGIFLLVPVATGNGSARRERISQRLRIPSGEILELELKQLDRAKTGMVAAASALITGIVLYKTLGDGGGGEPPGNGEPGPQDAIVLWRVPIGR